MVGVSNIVGVGVIGGLPNQEGGVPGGGDLSIANIVTQTFIYGGGNNTSFILADVAIKILSIVIDHGSYPAQIPNVPTDTVEIDADLLFAGTEITFTYIIQ